MKTTLFWKPTEKIKELFTFETDIKWINAVIIFSYHVAAVCWCYYYALPVKWQSVLFAVFMHYASGMGVSIGAHRYWTHRSFKATKPLQVMLLVMFSAAGQNTVQEWVRDHRIHHKYSDSHADPHNSGRGLFFSHIGWLMMKKHTEVIRRGKQVDISDVKNDPLLRWHERHFIAMKLAFCFVLPTLAGIVLWGENWRCAVAWQCFFRYLTSFHSELTVNSIAHAIGYRPYNKNIKPVESWFTDVVTLGDGCHNYHHAFPYDYRSAEFFDLIQLSSHLIKLWARLGLAYDLREATSNTVKSTVRRAGDGTHTRHHMYQDELIKEDQVNERHDDDNKNKQE